ncbi:hypothetical protein V6N13_029665 [Hibiscus sabdariffa]
MDIYFCLVGKKVVLVPVEGKGKHRGRKYKSRQSSQVSGEDGYNVSFMSKLMGNGSSKLRTDAYSSDDASSRDGVCHPAHL